MEWKKVLNSDIKFGILTRVTPEKGNLVYEYNPFRNYRLSQDMFEYKGLLYTLEDLETIHNIKPTETDTDKVFINTQTNEIIPDNEIILREAGELVDFVTDDLKVDLEHPVNILPQYSYDGSVNLILNDGIHTPKLINSRFSSTGKNTYEIIDRFGNDDTNIYDLGDLFETDASLYKVTKTIPKLVFNNTKSGGNLAIGNYHFYFKCSDADGNETDFVAESGLVSIFIGFHSPSSMQTGLRDSNSYKLVEFQLSNLDSSYDFVSVYYSRTSAEGGFSLAMEYIKVDKKYPVKDGNCKVIVTGFEPTIAVTALDINVLYNVIDSAKTLVLCLNMLFLGNVHKPEIPYADLQDLSLRICPYLKQEAYNLSMDVNYRISSHSEGYYDSKFIYDKTGYWGEELYRFGIVYILPNNELTPVFNVRGRLNIGEFGSILGLTLKTSENSDITDNSYDNLFTYFSVYKNSNDVPVTSDYPDAIRNYVEYVEGTNTINSVNYENTKGVCSFSPTLDNNTIYSIDFRISNEVIKELSKYVKGFFFVRQPRLPLKLVLGVTIGIDKISRTPCLATASGFLSDLAPTLNGSTHVETEDIGGVNYISESFLNRYRFEIKPKSKNFFLKFGTILAVVAIAVAGTVASIFTAGAAGAAAGAGIAAILSAGAASVEAAAITVGIVTGSVIAATAVSLGIAQGAYAIRLKVNKDKVALKGKETKPPKGYEIVETEDSRQISHDFKKRVIIKDPTKVDVLGILCPDFEINQPYFNNIFTGNKHLIKQSMCKNSNELSNTEICYFTNNNNNHFYIPNYYDNPHVRVSKECKLISVADSSAVGIDDLMFRSRAGQAEEAFRFREVGEDYKDQSDDNKKINGDIIRGNFGPYLAFNDKENIFEPGLIVDIYIPGYSSANINEYVGIRMDNAAAYSAITDRYSIVDIKELRTEPDSRLIGDANNLDALSKGYKVNAYRGDCYIVQFTHRLNRNFNDPSSPYNDDIVDPNTWKDNYDPKNKEKYVDINLGDVNAVRLGMWVTFRVRSNYNLNIRTIDDSYTEEKTMTGNPRGYYPYLPMSTEGIYKIPESFIYNRGFTNYLSERNNFNMPDVPYLKNWYGTRIMYSDIHITDAFKNGFRTFRGTAYRDYTRAYGEIVKLVDFNSNLICIFEHGIALIPISVTAGNVSSYLNTNNVLGLDLIVLSDTCGTQWAESVFKSPKGYIYGVDTIAKKIWKTDGRSVEYISDLKVQEFLINNISLEERELTPIIGVRNVKTHYNAYKLDILFTFYDNTYGFEEKVWNLCYNEKVGKFITFYSWVPSYMENINNIPFSFDRNTSKWIAKLGISHANNSFADGITLTTNIIPNNFEVLNEEPENKVIITGNETDSSLNPQYYQVAEKTYYPIIGKLDIANRILPENVNYLVTYTLERDNYKNMEYFGICSISDNETFKHSYLYLKKNVNELFSEIYYRNSAGNSYADVEENKLSIKESEFDAAYLSYPIFKNKLGKRINLNREDQVNPDKIVRLLNIKASIKILQPEEDTSLSEYIANLTAKYDGNTTLIDAGYYESVIAVIPEWNMQFLSTDFWKHGLAGIIDIADKIYPTYWYGKEHPFEFEFVVTENIQYHKIFDNLELISNSAEPESFHYEVIGDSYNFADGKVNMYIRLEKTKHLYQYNGFDILYDREYVDLTPNLGLYYTTNDPKLLIYEKSTMLPLYYSRNDTINDIEDYYYSKDGLPGKDFSARAGGEVVHYNTLDEYRIWNHSKAVNIKNSRLRGNMEYREDKWYVQINPLIIEQLNESKWKANTIPVELKQSPKPDEILQKGSLTLPEGWADDDITTWNKSTTSEAKLKDKWIKIKIRYNGKKLAIILAVKTMYRLSYS